MNLETKHVVPKGLDYQKDIIEQIAPLDRIIRGSFFLKPSKDKYLKGDLCFELKVRTDEFARTVMDVDYTVDSFKAFADLLTRHSKIDGFVCNATYRKRLRPFSPYYGVWVSYSTGIFSSLPATIKILTHTSSKRDLTFCDEAQRLVIEHFKLVEPEGRDKASKKLANAGKQCVGNRAFG
ncbi:MAG: hypothetical protein RBT70_02970 [Alphaproteobacteria bacterium]|jgi:hypothetical protein|nr:hypothetical protein [Alphaproteobacteria bacterium]